MTLPGIPCLFMGDGCDVLVVECGDAVANSGGLSILVCVLEFLACGLVSRQVNLFSVLLGNTVGMRNAV